MRMAASIIAVAALLMGSFSAHGAELNVETETAPLVRCLPANTIDGWCMFRLIFPVETFPTKGTFYIKAGLGAGGFSAAVEFSESRPAPEVPCSERDKTSDGTRITWCRTNILLKGQVFELVTLVYGGVGEGLFVKLAHKNISKSQ